jgi:hypothetical protein
MVLESRFMSPLTKHIVVTMINGIEGELETSLQTVPMSIHR